MGSNCLKEVLSKVIVDKKGKGLKIRGQSTWKNWWMKRMN